ncbi:MAG TPA: hypothetical protein VFU94_11775 [Conexibacter sp.]|nr:hypothetical protein [Conexibacter sp.]
MRRRSPQALVAVLALLPLALALGACGEDSLSAGQLRAQAGAICTRATRAIDRIPMPAAPDQGGRFLEAGLARLRPAAARLKALKAPHDLRGQYDRAAQLAAQEVALVARHDRAIAGGDDPADAFRRLAAALRPLTTEENAYWRALQIPSCVRQ